MNEQIEKLIDGLTYEDLVTIFEAAKIGLDSIPEDIGSRMDLSDTDLDAIGEKLNKAMA